MRGVIVVVCAWVTVAASYSAQAPTFGGYACADNCSGHAAGYRWAEQYRITDMDECRAGLSFFTRGVLSTLRTRIAVLKRMIMGILLTE
jgi:hypothetical protein